ncbi:hypothetical protein COC42_16605 [Sphingomonas spermidinifaciens]|uniref:Serine acetyltransferase n=1 Tax=Sphingomonas spermidinifaciens TaxID=1141889 RepID=A0A2A4B1A4_9SPHN|nr:hypothetical protein [Sphingomonas spermidinifaciens]PCD01732.1 hypothetical protein COC42_16605 [Sphingomonas spermidinifaciens]
MTGTSYPGFRTLVRSDLERFALSEGLPVTPQLALRMIFLMPGFQFVLCRRIQDRLYRVPVIGRGLRRVFWWWTTRSFGAEIAIGAEVGRALHIPHPYGIVVGVCRIGDGVTILQNVTIGKKSATAGGHPVIGDRVYLSAGAVIVGNMTIGDDATVGANSVVTGDVPAGTVAVGAPARILDRRPAAAAPHRLPE